MNINRIFFGTNESTFMVNNSLTLRFSKREEISIIRWAMELFTEWLLKGKLVEISHDYDPPWDSSGIKEQRQINSDDYEEAMQGTLAGWMDSCYSGNTTASYMSGCGLWHDTYEKVVSDYVLDTIVDRLKSQVGSDDDWFEIIEDDDYSFFACNLQTHIVEAIEIIPAKDAFQLCKKRVQEKLIQNEIKTQKHRLFIHECRERVALFQKKFLPWLPQDDVDKLRWKSQTMALQLNAALHYADEKTLEALLAVSLRGSFSNSVRLEIDKIIGQFYAEKLNQI